MKNEKTSAPLYYLFLLMFKLGRLVILYAIALAMMSTVYCGPVPVPAVGVGVTTASYHLRPRPPVSGVVNTRYLALEALATRVATGSGTTTAGAGTPPSPEEVPMPTTTTTTTTTTNTTAPAVSPPTAPLEPEPKGKIKSSVLGLIAVLAKLSQYPASNTITPAAVTDDPDSDLDYISQLSGGVFVTMEESKPPDAVPEKYAKYHKSSVLEYIRNHGSKVPLFFFFF